MNNFADYNKLYYETTGRPVVGSDPFRRTPRFDHRGRRRPPFRTTRLERSPSRHECDRAHRTAQTRSFSAARPSPACFCFPAGIALLIAYLTLVPIGMMIIDSLQVVGWLADPPQLSERSSPARHRLCSVDVELVGLCRRRSGDGHGDRHDPGVARRTYEHARPAPDVHRRTGAVDHARILATFAWVLILSPSIGVINICSTEALRLRRRSAEHLQHAGHDSGRRHPPEHAVVPDGRGRPAFDGCIPRGGLRGGRSQHPHDRATRHAAVAAPRDRLDSAHRVRARRRRFRGTCHAGPARSTIRPGVADLFGTQDLSDQQLRRGGGLLHHALRHRRCGRPDLSQI